MSENIKLQKHILNKAVRDPYFSREVLPRVPLSLFSEKSFQTLASLIRMHYQKTRNTLTEESLITLTEERLYKKNKLDGESEVEHYNLINEIYDIPDYTDDDVIDEKIESYVKQELRRSLFMEYIEKMNDDDAMADLDRRMREIMLLDIQGKRKEVINVIEDSDYKKESLRSLGLNLVSTGYKNIDASNDGGLGKGELGLIVAPSGKGKTTVMINLATNYVRHLKKNVLFIALEELENRMILKFEQTLTGRRKSDIITSEGLNEKYYETLQNFYKNHREDLFGNLYFSRFSPKTVTPAKIEQIISDVQIREGVDLDAVIIDYPDLLRNPRATGDVSEDGGDLFHEMRRIGQEQDVIMWTASQANRTAFGAELVTSAHMEGALKKRNAAELVLVVNQFQEERDQGFLRLYFDKVRNRSDTHNEHTALFRIDSSTIRMKEVQDEEEIALHKEILENRDDQAFTESRKRKNQKKKQESPDFVTEMANSKLAGSV